MEYFIISALVLTAVFCAYVSSLVSSLTVDDLNSIFADENSEKSDKFKKRLDNQVKGSTVIEFLLYSGAAVTTGMTAYIHSLNWYVTIAAVSGLFLFYLLTRTFFSGLGKRFAHNGTRKILTIFK